MSNLWKTLDDTLQQSIMTLSMRVEVKYGSQYRFTKEDKELIKLLMKSSYSQYPEVTEAWESVNAALNTRQKTHFSQQGVRIDAKAKQAAV